MTLLRSPARSVGSRMGQAGCAATAQSSRLWFSSLSFSPSPAHQEAPPALACLRGRGAPTVRHLQYPQILRLLASGNIYFGEGTAVIPAVILGNPRATKSTFHFPWLGWETAALSACVCLRPMSTNLWKTGTLSPFSLNCNSRSFPNLNPAVAGYFYTQFLCIT